MAFLDENGLAELWSLVKAEDVKALDAGVKVVNGSYAGNYERTLTLTFPFVPKLLFITPRLAEGNDDDFPLLVAQFGENPTCFSLYVDDYSGARGIEVVLNGTTVSLTTSLNAPYVMNGFMDYNYTVIG